MIDVMCPECLLTSSGSRLLTGVFNDLESTRPDDPTWHVERCTSCGQPRSIHDDLDGWTFGDTAIGDDRPAPSLIDTAPEWITVREAAYAARLSEAVILQLAECGRVESVDLLPGSAAIGVLVRTADIRATLDSKARTIDLAVTDTPVDGPEETDTTSVSRWELNRRKVLVGLGMAVSGALIPARAIAGGGPRLASATSVLDPLVVSMGTDTTDGKATGSKKDSGGHGSGGGGGGGGGRTTAIQSVTVQPDPIAAGGTATITIDATPRRRIVSYAIRASEGILVQDPQTPSIWTWRAA